MKVNERPQFTRFAIFRLHIVTLLLHLVELIDPTTPNCFERNREASR